MSIKPFILSCKAIILNEDNNWLILRRSSESKFNKNKWDLPGGKISKDESFDIALIREVIEETALDIYLTQPLGTSFIETPTTNIIYLMIEAHLKTNNIKLSNEHNAYAWVNATTIADYDLLPQFVETCKRYGLYNSQSGE